MWTLLTSSIRQLNNEAVSKISQHKRHVDAHHNWTLIIVGYVHKQGMCDSWHQRPQTGLNEGSDGLPSIPVDQSALFMTVICAHSLCRAAQRSVTIPGTQILGPLHLYLLNYYPSFLTLYFEIGSGGRNVSYTSLKLM